MTHQLQYEDSLLRGTEHQVATRHGQLRGGRSRD
jgi:hypothetical protein